MGVSLELDCSPWLDGKYKYTLKITRSVIKNGKRALPDCFEYIVFIPENKL
ncbi:hypothetical protein PAT01_22880 [Pseudoalteromonas atlantica]|uniref:Uncharacterized protein n=1 Tax=Pseudoalteromonas atlantica TaxID=288 RepID=A0ABQ0UIX6_PSEAF|nr:hypothetical protein PAT01_22880 [Pseudoalteromonas atlantica]